MNEKQFARRVGIESQLPLLTVQIERGFVEGEAEFIISVSDHKGSSSSMDWSSWNTAILSTLEKVEKLKIFK